MTEYVDCPADQLYADLMSKAALDPGATIALIETLEADALQALADSPAVTAQIVALRDSLYRYQSYYGC